ncbi:MAG: hypothetical protein AAGA10_09100 [Bacteroidota bacterium]
MEVEVFEANSGKNLPAFIETATFSDVPKRKSSWNFDWMTLSKTEGSEIYKLSLKNSPKVTEGLIMLSLMNEEMLIMNNIEISPHNYGSGGKHGFVAECLISFACLKSFEIGRNAYLGYLTFESKSELVTLYQEKYGAESANGLRMFIPPEQGMELIKTYL